MTDTPKVATYTLYTPDGRKIRVATQVTIGDQVIRFLDRMPKRLAIAAAHAELARRQRAQ